MKTNPLKIAVVNFSGNVGKSTIARHLLSPRMQDAVVVAVETINADGAGEITVKGGDFGQLQQDLLLEDAAIVDVGASNIEQFMSLMRVYRGSQDDFDLFIVPCVPELKQQKDTVECVNALADLGVPANKIWILFNMVDPQANVEDVFEPVLRFVSQQGKCQANVRAAIQKNEIFARLRGRPETIQSLLDDATDFKAEIKKTSDPEQRMAFAERLATKRLAKGVQENLNEVFGVLVS